MFSYLHYFLLIDVVHVQGVLTRGFHCNSSITWLLNIHIIITTFFIDSLVTEKVRGRISLLTMRVTLTGDHEMEWVELRGVSDAGTVLTCQGRN